MCAKIKTAPAKALGEDQSFSIAYSIDMKKCSVEKFKEELDNLTKQGEPINSSQECRQVVPQAMISTSISSHMFIGQGAVRDSETGKWGV